MLSHVCSASISPTLVHRGHPTVIPTLLRHTLLDKGVDLLDSNPLRSFSHTAIDVTHGAGAM